MSSLAEVSVGLLQEGIVSVFAKFDLMKVGDAMHTEKSDKLNEKSSRA